MHDEKYPRFTDDFHDFQACVDRFVLAGLPKAKFITSSSRVLTQGLCFAENIFRALTARSITSSFMQVPEASNSPVGNAQGISRADADLRHFKDFDVFIFTMGVSFAPEGQAVRFHSVEENVWALRTITQSIRSANPNMHIVYSVSPVPLNRSFSVDTPAVLADCVSKSTLRVAIDSYIREAPECVYYWPSFEIVRWLYPHVAPSYGLDDGLARHVNAGLVGLIVEKFLDHFSDLGGSSWGPVPSTTQ